MYFILFLLLLVILVLYFKPLIISFRFNTDENILNLNFYWLYPFIRAKIELINYSPLLSIYLFGFCLYSKPLKFKKRKRKLNFINFRTLALKNTYSEVYYGLNNPFITGITNVIIQFIQSFFNDIAIEHYPNFIPDNEYLIIKSGTELNIGKTINQILLQYGKRRKKYGSI